MVNSQTIATRAGGSLLIDGSWETGAGPEFRAVDPRTGIALDPAFHEAGVQQIDRALTAAARAWRETRHLPPVRWAQLLEAIAQQIVDLGSDLLQRAASESGLPVEPRLMGERARTCGQLKMFAQLVRDGWWVEATIDTAEPARAPQPRADIRRMMRSLGPVVVFDASNFPLAFGAAGGDTASALAAGNPVVIKAHPGHPGTDELIAQAVLAALKQCSLPAAMFQLLHGSTQHVGAAMVQHPFTQAVGFTGSLAGGRAIFDLANSRARPIPAYCEMGSLNPVVLLPGAIAQRGDAIAAGLAGSVTLGAGQFCTKPGLVLAIDSAAARQLVSTLADKLRQAPGFTLLSQRLQINYARGLEQARTTSMRTHVQAQCDQHARCTAALLEVSSDQWRANPQLHQEIFGPATIVVLHRDEQDLLQSIAALEGSLTGCVHWDERDDAQRVERITHGLEERVGRLIFNSYPTGVEVTHAMVHGGPYPATTAAGATSVGTLAIRRFVRPVCYQDVPDSLLPLALRNANPLGIARLVNGAWTTASL